jgi:hypothetical protein
LPLSRGRPKLIGKARPATNGIRTSTKYLAKVTEQPAKVNLHKHPKNALDEPGAPRDISPVPGVTSWSQWNCTRARCDGGLLQ